MQNWFFFENPNFKKVNLIKRAHLKKDCQLFLIKMYWSYFKYNDFLHTLYVYVIPEKKPWDS